MSDIYFDTSVVVDALAGRREALSELRRASRPWISRISWIEILAGVPAQVRRETEDFLAHFAIRDLSAEIARRSAALRSNRPALTLPDAVVFASAQEHGAILVTRNIGAFPASTPGVRIPYL